jgi:hypothetical protein
MSFGTLTLLWLLSGGAGEPSLDRIYYAPAKKPAASLVLSIDSNFHSVAVLEATNVAVRILPAEAQDMHLSKPQYDVECHLQTSGKLVSVNARADTRDHLIPVDILTYKNDDPTYVKLEIDQLYLTNRIDRSDTAVHTVYIDFYLRDDEKALPAN